VFRFVSEILLALNLQTFSANNAAIKTKTNNIAHKHVVLEECVCVWVYVRACACVRV